MRGFIEHLTDEGLKELLDAIDFQEFYLTKSDAEFEETYVRGYKGWF